MKTGTKITVAQRVRTCKVFVSRLAQDFSSEVLREFVFELTGDVNCKVEKLNTKLPYYSSFVVTCHKEHEETLLDPSEWEKGVLIRRYYEKRPNTDDPQNRNVTDAMSA